MTERDMLRNLNRERVARGVCRHCGGKIPCWSPYGDRAIGKRHTAASFRKTTKGA